MDENARQRSKQLVERGAAALRTGDVTHARNLLREALQLDPANDQAWVWVSGIVADDGQRRECLARALRYNPQNVMAQRGLAVLDARIAPADPAPVATQNFASLRVSATPINPAPINPAPVAPVLPMPAPIAPGLPMSTPVAPAPRRRGDGWIRAAIGIGTVAAAITAVAVGFQLSSNRPIVEPAALPTTVVLAATATVPMPTVTPDVRSLTQRAEGELRAGDAAAAITTLDEVLLLEPENSGALVLRGDARFEDVAYRESIDDYTRAIGLGVDTAAIYHNRGRSYLRIQEWALAERDFNEAITRRTDDPLSYLRRGIARKRLERFDAALEDLDAALKLDAANSATLVNRGEVYIALGQLAAARADFDAALQIAPDTAAAYRGRIEIALAQQDDTTVIADTTRLLAIEPAARDALRRRATAHQNIKRYALAIADLDALVDLDRENPDLYRDRGALFALLGDNASARNNYERALELYTQRGDAPARDDMQQRIDQLPS